MLSFGRHNRRTAVALTLGAALGLVAAACGLSGQGTGGPDLGGASSPGASAQDGSGMNAQGSLDGASSTQGGDGASSSGSDSGGGDAGAMGEAGGDAGGGDAGTASSDAGVDAGHDAGTTSFSYQCPSSGATVSSCASCAGNPIDCVLCGAGGAHQTFCVAQGDSCRSYRQTGFDWCACSYPNASACIIGAQECYSDGTYNNICITCGENLSNGFNCKSGGKCNYSNRTCN